MRLIILAPPGAGKGTQGALIKGEYGINQISSGDILRENKNKRTKLGKLARKYMDAGDLVPDILIINMLREELLKDEYENGFLLDGFPRTLQQAEELSHILTEMKLGLNATLILNVPKGELVSRLSARRSCKICGRSYHLIFNPPVEFDKCDLPCCGQLFQRPDDTRDTILNRLKVYDSKTQSLVEFYENQGIAHQIDGLGEISEIFTRIKTVLDTLKAHKGSNK